MDPTDKPKSDPGVDYAELARNVEKLHKAPPPRSITPSPESSTSVIQIGGVKVQFKDPSFLKKMLPYALMALFGVGGGAATTQATKQELPPAIVDAPAQIESMRTDIKNISQRINTLEQDSDEVKRRELPRLKKDVEGLIEDYEVFRKNSLKIVNGR